MSSRWLRKSPTIPTTPNPQQLNGSVTNTTKPQTASSAAAIPCPKPSYNALTNSAVRNSIHVNAASKPSDHHAVQRQHLANWELRITLSKAVAKCIAASTRHGPAIAHDQRQPALSAAITKTAQ
jgi:hypothetical protein